MTDTIITVLWLLSGTWAWYKIVDNYGFQVEDLVMLPIAAIAGPLAWVPYWMDEKK